ncbi:hypothetical protein H6F87_26265 [Cyanobacteria bacterium FACHB-502]|nr:hypothetical protein [Cyanobacteria bacterium FACHB-502]
MNPPVAQPVPSEAPASTISVPSQIHLVGGRKGGVGKTFLSRHLAEYLTQKQQQFSLVEADITIGDVGRVYGGFEGGKITDAVTISLSDDPRKYSEPDVIFQQAVEKQCVLVNLPAETNSALARWMHSVNLVQLCQDQNIDLYHWFVTDGCYASIRLLAESIEMLDGKLPHIVVRNEGRLNSKSFAYLEREPLYQKISGNPELKIDAAANLVCIRDFPVLGSEEQFYLDKHNLTYEAGVEAFMTERRWIEAQRVKTFAERATEVINQIFTLDLPAFHAKQLEASTANKLSTGAKRKSKEKGESVAIPPTPGAEPESPTFS